MKRILLFVATNLAVLVVISITFRLLGLDRVVMTSGNIDMGTLLVFSAVIGFSGSLISLFLSKTMAKHGMACRSSSSRPTPTSSGWSRPCAGRPKRRASACRGRHLRLADATPSRPGGTATVRSWR